MSTDIHSYHLSDLCVALSASSSGCGDGSSGAFPGAFSYRKVVFHGGEALWGSFLNISTVLMVWSLVGHWGEDGETWYCIFTSLMDTQHGNA